MSKLPPLPEPTLEAHEYELWGQNVKGDFYTAEQMQAYATAAVEALQAQIGQGDMSIRLPDSVLDALDNFEKKKRSPFQAYLVAGLVAGLVDELRTALFASVPPAPQAKPCPLCKSQHGPQICCTTVDIALTTQAVPAPQQKSLTNERGIAACGLMPLIEDYAIAVRNGDKNSSMVLKKTIEASLEELESLHTTSEKRNDQTDG